MYELVVSDRLCVSSSLSCPNPRPQEDSNEDSVSRLLTSTGKLGLESQTPSLREYQR